MDIPVKDEFVTPTAAVIRWYLRNYTPDEMDKEWLERCAKRMETESNKYIRTNGELYVLKEALSEAKNESSIDSIPQSLIEEIFNWVNDKYMEYK